MTKRNYIVGILLLAAGLLAGCAGINEPEQRTEIAMMTGVSGMQHKVRGYNNNAALQGDTLKIDAYFHDTEVAYLEDAMLRYDGGVWKFWDESENEQVHYYWPFDGAVYDPSGENIEYTSLDFVGFCPYEKPDNIGTPTYDHATGVSFTCTMSDYMTLAGQDTLQEYVVAVLDDQTLADQVDHDGVPLTFKHPLAQIKFIITAASGTHVQIDSISIPGLYTGGTCAFDGTTMSWSDKSGSAPISIVQELKRGGRTESTPFFVIPSNYGTKYLTVKATWDSWSDVTISDYGTNVNFNWEAGRSYTYNLTLDQYGLKVDSVRYTEQW